MGRGLAEPFVTPPSGRVTCPPATDAPDLGARSDRDLGGLLVLAFIALGPAVRVASGLVRHEGPTPSMVGLSVLLSFLFALALSELVGAKSQQEP